MGGVHQPHGQLVGPRMLLLVPKNMVRQGYFYHWSTMIWCASSKLVAIRLFLLVTTSKNLCCIRLQDNDY
jgi:hypothetical protein